MKYITTLYDHYEYKAGLYNTGILEAKDGTMFFANADGILHYNGYEWSLIKTSKEPQNLAISDSGVIYVAAFKDVGYLEKSDEGSYFYNSLLEKLSSNEELSDNCWRVVCIGETVFFQFPEYLLVYKNNKLQKLNMRIKGNLSTYDRKVYVNDVKNKRLVSIDENLNIVPLSKYSGGVEGFLVYDKTRFLIVGWKRLYLYENGKIEPLKSEANNWISKNYVWKAIKLSDGSFAFTSSSNGMVMVSKAGKILYRANKDMRLSKKIFDIFEDSQSQLWLALDKGIAKINFRLQLKNIDESYNFRLQVSDIYEFNNELYLSAVSGPIMKIDLRAQNAAPTIFKTNFTPNFILKVNNRLFISSNEGLFEYKNSIVKKINSDQAIGLHESNFSKTKFYISKANTIKFYDSSYEKPKLISEQYSKEPFMHHHLSIEEAYGIFWLFCGPNLIKRFDMNTKTFKEFKTPYSNLYAKGTLFNKHIYMRLADHDFIYNIEKDEAKIVKRDASLDDIYVKQFPKEIPKDIQSYLSLFKHNFYDVKTYSSDSLLFWYHTVDKVYKYNVNHKINEIKPKAVIINSILVNNVKISFMKNNLQNIRSILPDTSKNIEFRYSYPVFDEEKRHQFQTKLEGYDQNWSDYSLSAIRRYEMLKHGYYTFMVKAKDMYGNVSGVTKFQFEIETPIYLSAYAYALYFILLILAIFLLIRLRTIQLLKRQKVLEETIEKRTEELRLSVSYKNDFFANISHEFRTPLTLILGYLDEISKDKKNDNVKIISNNAKRLLHLVNQLLELSRSEHGQLELKLSHGDLSSFVSEICELFRPICKMHNIELIVNTEESIKLYFDHDIIDKVMINLISNAIKFNVSGGKVKVKTKSLQNKVKIIVSDSGIGIKKDFLPFVLERFRQGERSNRRYFHGSGIGLSLVKELVDCHQGKLEVKSEEGNGTTCILELDMNEKGYSQKAFQTDNRINKEFHSSVELVQAELDIIDNNHNVKQLSKDLDNILLVEDNLELSHYIVLKLKNIVNVSTAFDGVEGLKKAKEIQPKLIISDVMMPNMDGIEFCDRIKRDIDTSHIPVILLTAKSEVQDKIDGLISGADDYITKPFNPDELRLKVTNIIKSFDNLREKYKNGVFISPAEITSTETDKLFLEKLNKLISQQIHETDLKREKISQQMSMSISTINRKLKVLVQLTLAEYIRIYRLQKSAQLLKTSSLNISEISYELGFSKPSEFSRIFKKQFGKTPKDFKNSETTNTI